MGHFLERNTSSVIKILMVSLDRSSPISLPIKKIFPGCYLKGWGEGDGLDLQYL